jgi:hypothetical protein
MRDIFKLAHDIAQFSIKNADEALEMLQVVNRAARESKDASLNFDHRRGTANWMQNSKKSTKSTRQPWPPSNRRMQISPGN